MIIGILDLQGAVAEHQQMLKQCQVASRLVKTPADLKDLAGLIIPGGESTAIKKLLIRENMLEPLKAMVAAGFPVFGTCAGLVLLTQTESLAGFDGEVVRNGFGRQKDSFEEDLTVLGFDSPFVGIFIRAPYLKSVGSKSQVLAKTDDGRIVAAIQDNLLVTAFHPELTADTRFHQLFIQACVK
ncbi:pyridoxal 5'-phosphate synthase glutaminase subunit PdxT [Companilactobacillus sp. FL22-1]|uniref:pyridoxal 5'-phosphate synthase glutaminase subunit PdxT n=1 Tax=Companilactobacillus sp. FL22-1 TaxID=3373892 RepID=UPI0037547D06